MRKVIFGINLSADGCCDHTRFSGGEDILEYFGLLLQNVDLVVYGRKTYELMVPYWPDVARNQSMTKAENKYALAFDAVDKLVFSRTLTTLTDKRSRVARSGLKDEIMKLKQGSGKNISIGGVDLPSQILKAGLVDEFHMVVHPVIVGKGRRLFEEAGLNENYQLKLAETKILRSGCVALRYVKKT